ncbi:EAL domain-containing protein [Kordiimonas marina]|uniref:EAL domain-containing protein n=1 Tax=Kordiimonas marina TaxID=2872312 RepID=UPI001FF33EBA|nr:EAL domain-containing protein [Kordiimonas marina]MCJ9429645.1 EAL domain-containing protein [Kordiimonas marina]
MIRIPHVACLFLLSFILSSSIAAGTAPPSDTVIFGGDRVYPPFEWDDKGTPTGFHIDLENALAEIGKAKAEHRLDDWPVTTHALETGDVDVVPMLISDKRREKFLFTSAFYFMDHAIYAEQGTTKIPVLADLSGHTVAVEQTSYAQNKLETGYPDVHLILTGNTLEALQAVAQHKADYALLTTPTAEHLIRDQHLAVRRVSPPLWPQGYAFAVRKDRPDLLAWLQNSLNQAIVNGRYEAVYNAWRDRLEPTQTSSSQILKTSALIAGPLLLLAALGFGWSFTLRRRVAARTAELQDELKARKDMQAQLRHFADHDTHTGLPEYHHFIELGDKVLAEASSLPSPSKEMVVFKLAETETIIRTFGYSTGEGIIEEFAERLKGGHFDVTSYFGRGIFAVLCDQSTMNEAYDALSEQLETCGLGLYPQLICGIAHWPGHGTSCADLVKHAETALAVSIDRNHDCTTYDPTMEPDQTDLRIVAEFRKSGGTDLQAALQPQIDLKTGSIVGAEALVRWHHEELGFISPAKFIPLLEKAGLITKVTARMVDEAARISASLRRRGIDCTISVNVAVYDILETELPSIIKAALDRHGALASDLKLELTETSVAEDSEGIKIVLKELGTAGIYTSIDDFGTGYSSLSYLSSFPIRELKVDQMFVRDMVTCERNHSIVSSTIAMAHALGLSVVAEGAEDQETLTSLNALGCNRVQGYVISKPLSEDDFNAFLTKHQGTFSSTVH